ncbi:MAG: TrkH family potassium uptake protein [Rhodopirellula sp.]|nr:TrkH family potassium uptake protein [Rhodopirellula sp.]
MNTPLVARMLSLVAMLIGGSMVFSLPWGLPIFGGRWEDEQQGMLGLLGSIILCFAVGGVLRYLGRNSRAPLFRREAMAVVGLSWVLSTVLGALPYELSVTQRAPGIRMHFIDAMFESQSGFSTTGATVLTDLEDPALVPRCILFWRSSTHFLGGLGIIVLFVAILGQGSAGKAMMRAEMPGPSHSSPQARIQHTAWVLFLIYAGLNLLLTFVLMVEGLSVFDALCHAFGTMATGGFSTYNASVAHFATVPGLNGPLIEMTIVGFMFLAGTNFMLLYALLRREIRSVLADVEWRTYTGIIAAATVAIVVAGMYFHDFRAMTVGSASIESTEEQIERVGAEPRAVASEPLPVVKENRQRESLGGAVRYALFQVVSIMTTTGFCTADFDGWNSFAQALLLILMFVGGCAGSTSGGLKVVRHILFFKTLRLETEKAYHPSVVRPLRLQGVPVEDQQLRMNVPVYFGLALAIFTLSWLFVVAVEPESTWTDYGHEIEHKLIDAASAVAATLNNIGPGLGVVGATKNYANFSPASKLLFIWLMMLGRLEIYVILVLFAPSFWRRH